MYFPDRQSKPGLEPGLFKLYFMLGKAEMFYNTSLEMVTN